MKKDPATKTEKPLEYYRSKSVDELFAEALVHENVEDELWNPVSELRVRGTPEIFEKAKELCASQNPQNRIIGLDVLAQLGHSMESHRGILLDKRLKIALDAISEHPAC